MTDDQFYSLRGVLLALGAIEIGLLMALIVIAAEISRVAGFVRDLVRESKKRWP